MDSSDYTPHPRSLDFPVVGIGASAGGAAALGRFLERIPKPCDMAFVVVLHLSPKHESMMAEILQRTTPLKVLQVTGRTKIEREHVYIIPPTKNLEMVDGELRLTESTRDRGPPVAIDVFFRTLASAHGDHSFAIVMSGLGSDGALGVASVREAGGVSFAQAPADSEYDSMPRAAIATGAVDFVMPVADMPQKLVDLWANARVMRIPLDKDQVPADYAPGEQQPVDEAALKQILTTLRVKSRHDFRFYKRATVLRRIERRMQVNGLPSLDAYRRFLETNADEVGPLLQDMLISVTHFFRDREAFDTLEKVVVPALFTMRKRGEPIRIWLPGCATGEEAYSLAMLMREAVDAMASPPEVQIFASDIDEHALQTARAGLYPQGIAADLSPARLRRFFQADGEQYRVSQTLRELVLFANHNVLRDPPFSRLNLISCRNLLIYLESEAQRGLFDVFRFALGPGGYLFLGSSESAPADESAYKLVDKKARIYQVVSAVVPGRGVSTLPPGADNRGPTVQAAVPERKPPSFADWHARALERFAPPSVLIDEQQAILHLSPGVDVFLSRASGTPSHNLIANALSEIRLELRTALFRMQQSGEPATVRASRDVDGERRRVTISARPFRDGDQERGYALVMFDERPDDAGPPLDASVPGASKSILDELESEIVKLKTHLQDTIERSDTSNEELKASNEELQAINEELRSASEELETSKEELQSMNEELVTVNYELKTKVEETAQINDDLQNLIASTNLPVVFVDAGMRIKRFTPRATDLFNLIPGDVGRSLLDIRHRLDTETLTADADEAFRTLRPIERELRSDTGHSYLSRVVPYRTADNKIEGAVMTFLDITSRVVAERNVIANEARLRAATSTREFAILTMGAHGEIQTWNPGAERVFGYVEGEALGKPFEMLFTPEERQLDTARIELEKARADGSVHNERWHLRKDGSRVFARGVTTGYVIGDVQGFAKIVRDDTQTKAQDDVRAREHTRQGDLLREVETSVRVQDEFLAVMSHELKHPLNLIHVNAELLTNVPELRDAPIVRRAAEAIRSAVAGQARIIDDLLDLSRARTGKMTLTMRPIRVDEIVGRIAGAMHAQSRERGIDLVEAIERSDAVVVMGDTVRVEQIVWNLLSNALKFTSRGGTITVRLTYPDGHAVLEVADTGRGIDPKALPRIFSMFNQEMRSPDSNEGGMGIGLALVKELVEAQGGSVEANSPGVNRGATFTVRLPRTDGAEPTSNNPEEDALRGLRILLVDDMSAVLEPFAELLDMYGAAVTTAPGGAEALALLEREPFDLLISDVGMPGMDGYQLVDALRHSKGPNATLAAIALTGYGRPGDAQRALQVGFDAHLPKPTPVDQLTATVARLRSRTS